MIYYLKPNRVYRSYFGGKRLDKLCGKKYCEDTQFPEEWIASTVRAFNAGREDIVEGPSVCENGKLLKEIINKNPKEFLGQEEFNKHGENMSILVKLLDAAERLFIQCHPTISFAKKYFNSDFGKTECWYIISAEKNACVYIGFKPEITREKWQECFDNQDVSGMLELMHKISVNAGDLIFVEGGVPHAIGEGCLLCELQEPTDYMVIPERTSKSGITLTDKKMHGGLGFEKMMDCFVYEGLTEEELRNKYVRHPKLTDNCMIPIVDDSITDKFKMDCLKLKGKASFDFGNTYAVATAINGNCKIVSNGKTNEIRSGNSFIVSANNGEIIFDGNATLMICRP
ncbi:MAG: class I mannose-6-phosphate isomerase [Alphaproteobacteria bacterium]|nr:class I mannose-6-phosphate isomerase [Alphaproteobacteria bacterium]